MFLSNISNDVLEFILKFLSGIDKLNLIKANKMLIYNLKFDKIKIRLDLKYHTITCNDLFYLTGVHSIDLHGCTQITNQHLRYLAGKPALTSGKLKGIHTINLSYCNLITNEGLQYLAGKPALTSGKLKRSSHD